MFRHLLFTLLLLLTTGALVAQGWERVYYGGGQDEVNGLAMTPDGGYVMTGYYNNAERLYLIKTDADGNLQWSQRHLPPAGNIRISGLDILVSADSSYIMTGWVEGFSNRNVLLSKSDAYGNLLWTKIFDSPANLDDEGQALLEMPDGSLVIVGHQTNANDTEDLLVIHTDADGNLIWQKAFGQAGEPEKGYAVTMADNGDIIAAGEYKNNTLVNKDIYVVRLDTDGNLMWENTYGLLGTFDEFARSIVATDDDAFVLAGSTSSVQGGAGLLMKIDGNGDDAAIWYQVYPQTSLFGLARDHGNGFFASGIRSTNGLDDLYILHADATGNRDWEASAGKGGPDVGYAIVATPDGGAAAAGLTQPFVLSFEQAPYLVKTDADGVIFTSYLQGNVFLDLNGNCLPDGGEGGLEDWIIKVESPNFSRYIAADQDGNFLLLVDTGSYSLQLIAPNDFWSTCDDMVAIQVPDFYDTVEVAVPVQGAVSCPRNEVDIQTPLLRKCADNVYTVQYCNSGTVPSLDTRIVVTVDTFLSVVSSSIPWVFQQGREYTFAVGTLNPGECKTFTLTAFLDCNTLVGQTHCVQAYITPDTFCIIDPQWDGSIVAAKARCEDGEVRMVLTNKGQLPMLNELGFVIAEDVIMLTPPGDPNNVFQLAPGEEATVFTTPANGKTYRIIAEQSPGYPGVSYPTAAVEGCLSDTSGGIISTGYYTMFPDDEADAFVASDCQESNETDYNPIFLKRGHPKGYDNSHFVSPETDLEYLIRFTNSGSDTVFQVIVRDTLSPALDPATVYPGAASHPFDFQVYGGGIVQFTIPNANLLPGSSNSEGFVSFRVAQKPELDCGTVIFNTAAVYFDFNAPVLTNETFHTICERDSFIVVNTRNIHMSGAGVKVYPNPFVESATFEVTGVKASNFRLEVYDIQGRLLFNQFYAHPTFRLFRNQIPTGAHIYRLVADGRPVASGKIMVTD